MGENSRCNDVTTETRVERSFATLLRNSCMFIYLKAYTITEKRLSASFFFDN